MKNIVFAASTVLILSSCASTTKQVVPVRREEISISPVVAPMKVADYSCDMSQKVTGTFIGNLTSSAEVISNYKDQAVTEAINSVGCDFLVNPTYTIQRVSSKLNVTVTGYAAKYTELRDVVPSDTLWMEHGSGLPARGHILPSISSGKKRIY